MSPRPQRTCPAWCERTHAAEYGSAHRAEVGHLDIQGHQLYVYVVQFSSGPRVMLSSDPATLVIERDKTEDMRAVVTLLGWPFLAQLIERAAWIAERFDRPTRHAATEVVPSGS